MKINNKGFSLVELLAVVAILAVLVTVGISAYSKYVEDSKRTMYAKMAKDYINEARVQISSKEIKKISNPTYSYYISIEKLSDNDPLEPSPFGKWNEAYVIFVPGKNGQDRYYFASIDEVGWMIDGVEESKITKNSVRHVTDKDSLDKKFKGDGTEKIITINGDGTRGESKETIAWTISETKKCFSFTNLNNGTIRLNYYNLACGKDVTIPTQVGGKKVTEIYTSTFDSMGITSVNLPSTLTSIGSRAFISNNLTSVNIPSGCKTIGSEAFYGNKISSVKIPSSVSTIGQRAFYNNKINGYIYKIVPNKNASIGSCAFCRNSVYGAGFTFNGQAVKGYIGDFSEFADKRFIIPTETPDGKPVTEISDSAFYGLPLGGYTVVIPSTVTKIGGSAFSFSGVSAVNLPKGLKRIDGSAFYSCNLTSLDIPDTVTSIGGLAFNRNSVSASSKDLWIYRRTDSGIDYSTIIGYSGANRTNLVIPTTAGPKKTTLTTIGDNAFRYLDLRGSLVIPSTVSSYGSLAFNLNYLSSIDQGYDTKGNKVVSTDGIIYKRTGSGKVDTSYVYSFANNNNTHPVIPSGVKTIGPYAFYYSRIQSISLPEGLTTIGYNAFELADLRGTVTIPSTVTSIGSNAFYKAKTWTSFNYYMTKIVNKTNRAFDWRSITGGPSAANFVTGTVENWYGDIEVVRG